MPTYISIWLQLYNHVVCVFLSSTYLPMVLVGNKIDLKNDRIVTKKEGEELAAQLKVHTYTLYNIENVRRLTYIIIIMKHYTLNIFTVSRPTWSIV